MNRPIRRGVTRREALSHMSKIAAMSAMGGFQMVATSKAESSKNLHVPPEEALHEATFMQWPVSKVVYTDPVFLEMVQQTIADIANAISEFEPVIMLMDIGQKDLAKRYLSSTIEIWDIPTEDLWARDSGPLFAIKGNGKNDGIDDGKLCVSHIQFNGWGEKQLHKLDAQIAKKVAQRLDLPLIDSGLKGEAGGVEHDGHGLLMAHESSWVNDNRNPGIDRNEIEQHLLSAYGANKMIWSDGVWDEDITDYHIDSLARFTGAGKALINLPEKPDMDDPFHRAALETYDALVAAGFVDGESLVVIPEPNKRRVNSIDFVASYANYYVCNGGLIAPQFGDGRTDQIAVDALQRAYPDREIVTLNVDALGEIGGGIHCATQQWPSV